MKRSFVGGILGFGLLAGCVEQPGQTTAAVVLPAAASAQDACVNQTASDAEVRADQVTVRAVGSNASGTVYRTSVFGATYACTANNSLQVVDFRPVG